MLACHTGHTISHGILSTIIFHTGRRISDLNSTKKNRLEYLCYLSAAETRLSAFPQLCLLIKQCILHEFLESLFAASCRVKLSRYRPGLELETSRISRQLKHKGGKVISPKHRSSLPLRKCSRYSLLLEADSTPWPLRGRKD